jgi:glycosyltransferase involved in cell wall biosynthesis
LRVLHVAPSFYPAVVYGGPTESTYRLTLALATHAGCEIDVLTTDANGPGVLSDLSPDRRWTPVLRMHVRYCHRTFGESTSLEMMRALPAAIRGADVVHLMAVFSAPTIPTLALCRLFGKPLVWSPRGALQRWEGTRRPFLKSLWEAVCRLVAPRSLTLHLTSDEERVSSMRRFPRARAVVIPNGVVLPETRHVGAGAEFRMVFLGRLDPIKGLENLIAACSLLRLSRPWRLTLAGSGTTAYEKLLDDQIRATGLTERVRRTGALAQGGKAAFFAEADVLILPSHSENFGIVVAEALAHGVPVIVSAAAPWSRVDEVGCGLSVSNAPQSLAGAMTRLAESDCAAMGSRGREWMQREFSWDSVAGGVAAAYRSLSAQP